MPLTPVVNAKPLTNRDRQFLALYFANGMNARAAWSTLCEQAGRPCTQETAEVSGSKALKRCRQSGDLRAILEERGLDDLRLANEIDRLLKVKRLAFSPTGEAHEFDDGPTQAKAAEMLKDILGHNSAQEINVNNRADSGLVLVLQGAKEIAPEEVAG